jgi:hypothetical protein
LSTTLSVVIKIVISHVPASELLYWNGKGPKSVMLSAISLTKFGTLRI